jgi:hypothetical protein
VVADRGDDEHVRATRAGVGLFLELRRRIASERAAHDVELLRDGPVDGPDHVRGQGAALFREDLQDMERDAGSRADQAEAVVRGGDDAGHARAVSEAVPLGLLFRNGVVVHEVVPAAIRRLQIGMPEIDSGVDDSDAHALAAREEPYRGRIDARDAPGSRLRDVEARCGHRRDEPLDIRLHVSNPARGRERLCFLVR